MPTDLIDRSRREKCPSCTRYHFDAHDNYCRSCGWSPKCGAWGAAKMTLACVVAVLFVIWLFRG